jgi:hypothetical protein
VDGRPRFPRIGTRPMTNDQPMPRVVGHPWPGAGDRPRRSGVVYPAPDPARLDALERAWHVAQEKRRGVELELARIAELETRIMVEMRDAGASLRDIGARVGRSHTTISATITRADRS